jgi:hypothetical protein
MYNARIEYSDTEDARRTGLLASAQTEPGQDLGVVGSVVGYRQESKTGFNSTLVDLRLGTAWRPEKGPAILLHRIDLVYAPSAGSESLTQKWKLIDNLHFNYHAAQWQLSAHLGAKYALSRYEGTYYDSITTFTALEIRRNLTPRWDAGFHSGVLASWDSATYRPNLGVSVGRSFAKNVWVSIGYNFTGFADYDFTAARYTQRGVFVRFRLKFDQESLAGLLRAIKEE